jgi:HEPN domain-containing protein
MKPETQEWIGKAEGDWKVASREILADDPVWSVICFLAQQCAEKYLKAFLEEHHIAFRKTHDLIVLVNSSGGRLPGLDPIRQQLAHLSIFGIATRYPGMEADQPAAENAVEIAKMVRAVVRSELGLRG